MVGKRLNRFHNVLREVVKHSRSGESVIKEEWVKELCQHCHGKGEVSTACRGCKGKGITANRLEEIRERLNQTEIETEQSIGLRNVHERLQRFFGESYGLTIEGKEGEGTTIRLSFVA